MYEALVARVRYHIQKANFMGLKEAESTLLLAETADAIEELAAFKAQITDGHFYCMRDGVLYEAKVEMPKGKSIQLPRIEFAEEGET